MLRPAIYRAITVSLSEAWTGSGAPEAAVFAASVLAGLRAFAATVGFASGASALVAAFSLPPLSVVPRVGGPVPASVAASVAPCLAARSASPAASDTSGRAWGCQWWARHDA